MSDFHYGLTPIKSCVSVHDEYLFKEQQLTYRKHDEVKIQQI